MQNFDTVARAWTDLHAAAPDLFTPIENEEQYRRALSAVEELMLRLNEEGDEPGPLDDLLDLLTGRVAAYEASILPPHEKRPELVLAYLLEDRGLTQSALAEQTGIDQSTISKLLRGTREFSKAQAKRFSEFFGVPREVFLA